MTTSKNQDLPLSEDALMRQFMRYSKQIKAYAYAVMHDYHLAEDVLQEVGVVLIRRCADYDSSRSFLSWALGITRRKTLETLRARGRDRVMYLDEDALDCLDVAFEKANTGDYMRHREDALAVCLKRLSLKGREVFGMKYVKRMSAQSIAAVRKQTVASINSLLQRLRAKLIECVEQQMRRESAT